MLPKLKTWLATLLFLGIFASATALPAQPPADSDAYLVNAGDAIEIYVWGDERLQRSMKVLPDGSVSFPLVGRIIVEGKKATEIETEIATALAPQYNEQPPSVTVSVVTTSGYTFSVIGRVRSPGFFTPGRYINLLDAITMAGGPDEFASLDDVTIFRKTANGLTAERYNLKGALKGKLTGAAAETLPDIKGGDTVVIP